VRSSATRCCQQQSATPCSIAQSSTAAVLLQDGFLEKHGVKLGFMSAFVKAASDALHLVPAVNAVIDGDELVYRDYTDISIAVATPKGLVVPVLRNVDALNFAGIEKVFSQTFCATFLCTHLSWPYHHFPTDNFLL